MKNTSRISICLVLGILLAGCGQLAPGPAPTATFSSEVAAINTAAVATVSAKFTQVTAPSMTTTATLQPRSTDRPYPTPLPTIDPIELPNLLKTKIAIQPETFNGHVIQKVTGWNYGFNGFQWMDSNHLLLSAVIGPRGEVSLQPSYPAVINLDSQKVWVPRLTKTAEMNRTRWGFETLPRWSAKLGALVTTESISSGDAVMLYNAEGDFIAIYPGKLLGISPSGTKILVGKGTWIDLISGKKVDFDWDEKYLDSYWSNLNWSEDETRVFTCCHLYGNAKTGESYSFSTPYDEYFGFGTWILNDNYFVPRCCYSIGIAPGPGPGYIPVFEPSKKTYLQIGEQTNLPTDSNGAYEDHCNFWSISPNNKYVWAQCLSGSNLVDLANFTNRHYPDYSLSVSWGFDWSPDSNFVKITMSESGGKRPAERIVSVISQEVMPVPDGYSCSWLSSDNFLICLSNKDQTVSLLDPQTLSVQKTLDFPTAIQGFFWTLDKKRLILSNKRQTLSLLDTRAMSIQKETALPIAFREIIWSPNSERIALVAEDNSLWQIDYPSLENLEQLTPAMPGSIRVLPGGTVPRVKNVTWSPDGASLAFIGDLDIYIVDVKRNP